MRALQDGITVTGTGQATGRPDVLHLDLAAEVRADSVQPAWEQAGEVLGRVREALLAHGVAPEDVASSDTALHPDWDRQPGARQGYVAQLGLHATLRDLADAGRFMSDAVAAGGDASRVNGFHLSVEDPAALRREARALAFADARATAQQYAELAGRALGSVLSVTERVAPSDVPARAAAMVKDTPFEAGSATVTVSVDVRWALA